MSNHRFVRFNTSLRLTLCLATLSVWANIQNTKTESVRSMRHTANSTYSISTLDTLSPTSLLLLPLVFSLALRELLPKAVENERVRRSASTRIIIKEFPPQRTPVSAISDKFFLNNINYKVYLIKCYLSITNF